MSQPSLTRGGRFGPARAAGMLTAGSGAAAMALGIVSVGLQLDGLVGFSLAWLVAAALVWLMLATIFVTRLTTDRRRWNAEAHTAPALTAVAATTVLGTRVSQLGWNDLALAALCLAAISWLVLMPSIARHLQRPVTGAHFLVCVATEGLAVLAAAEAQARQLRWLEVGALVMLVLGLALYAVVASRFDLTQLRTGAGDQWVASGALAISALAGARILGALGPLHWTPAWRGPLRVADVTILGLALAGYLALVVAELRWPRLHYDVRRWATAFPLGMTAAALFSVAAAADIGAFHDLGEMLIWPAVLICLVLAFAAGRRWHGVAAAQ